MGRKKVEKKEIVSSIAKPKQAGVKDTYLPSVLVKLGICENNVAARIHIREVGVLINGVETHSCDATTEGLKMEQFELTVDEEVYDIFLI